MPLRYPAANRGDLETSIEKIERAISVQPSNAQAHQWYGETLQMLGYMVAGNKSIV